MDDDILRGARPRRRSPGWTACWAPICASYPGVSPPRSGSSLGRAQGAASRQGADADRALPQIYRCPGDTLSGTLPGEPRYPARPSDMAAVLRGHSQSVLDLLYEPEEATRLLAQMAEIFRQITVAAWERIPLWHGGYYDAQYQLWAPGPHHSHAGGCLRALLACTVPAISSARGSGWRAFPLCVYAPALDTSMFLLEAFLEIEELRCLEVNENSSPAARPSAACCPTGGVSRRRAGRC